MSTDTRLAELKAQIERLDAEATAGPWTVELQAELDKCVEALRLVDHALAALFWTSDDGNTIREGNPEDSEAPQFVIDAWNLVRAALRPTSEKEVDTKCTEGRNEKSFNFPVDRPNPLEPSPQQPMNPEPNKSAERELLDWAESILCNSLPMPHCSQEEWDEIITKWRDQKHEAFPDGPPPDQPDIERIAEKHRMERSPKYDAIKAALTELSAIHAAEKAKLEAEVAAEIRSIRETCGSAVIAQHRAIKRAELAESSLRCLIEQCEAGVVDAEAIKRAKEAL